MIVVQVEMRSLALITRGINIVLHVPLGLMVKSVPHALQLELGFFVRLIVKTLFGHFKQHIVICSTRLGRI